jgi:hypothetical protein
VFAGSRSSPPRCPRQPRTGSRHSRRGADEGRSAAAPTPAVRQEGLRCGCKGRQPDWLARRRSRRSMARGRPRCWSPARLPRECATTARGRRRRSRPLRLKCACRSRPSAALIVLGHTPDPDERACARPDFAGRPASAGLGSARKRAVPRVAVGAVKRLRANALIISYGPLFEIHTLWIHPQLSAFLRHAHRTLTRFQKRDPFAAFAICSGFAWSKYVWLLSILIHCNCLCLVGETERMQDARRDLSTSQETC